MPSAHQARFRALTCAFAFCLLAVPRVLNLFNRDCEEVFGYPSPGRTAFAGVRIAASR